MRGKWPSLLVGSVLSLLATVSPVRSHSFSDDSGFYDHILSGTGAVFLDLQVATSVLAAALLFALWNAEGLIKIWPGFLLGNVTGFAVSAMGILDSYFIQFAVTLLFGLAAAAALSLPVIWMRGLALIAGAIPVVTILFGHKLGDVPVPFMLGMVFGLNLLLAAAAGIVSLSLQYLPYGWVRIAWRAIAAWVVAVTIMMLALELSALPTEPDNLRGTSDRGLIFAFLACFSSRKRVRFRGEGYSWRFGSKSSEMGEFGRS